MFPHVHAAQIKLSGASAGPTVMSKLNLALAIISQQAETIAIQQTVIENAHQIKATADEALACAEDETEAAHLQWMECLQKLGIAEMQRQMTYFVLGGRHIIACPGCTRSSVLISELIDEDIKLVGLRFGEMRRIQEVTHKTCVCKSIPGSYSY
jgi:hypothetical protein